MSHKAAEFCRRLQNYAVVRIPVTSIPSLPPSIISHFREIPPSLSHQTTKNRAGCFLAPRTVSAWLRARRLLLAWSHIHRMSRRPNLGKPETRWGRGPREKSGNLRVLVRVCARCSRFHSPYPGQAGLGA